MDWPAGSSTDDLNTWKLVKDAGRICRFVCCFGPLIFLVIWMIDAICGAIYYDVWSPKFDLEDLQINGFNISPSTYQDLGDLELNYDMLFFVQARGFSKLRMIETFTYHLTTSYNGLILGESSTPTFHPRVLDDKTTSCLLNSTQSALHFPLQYETWSSLQNDTQVNNNVLLQVAVQGRVSSGLFWGLTKTKTRNCDVNIMPPSPTLPSQIMNMTCTNL